MDADKQAIKLYQELLSLEYLEKENLTTALGQYLEKNEAIDFLSWLLKNGHLESEQLEIIRKKMLQSPQAPSIAYSALSEAFCPDVTMDLSQDLLSASEISTAKVKPDEMQENILDTTLMEGFQPIIVQDFSQQEIGGRFKIEAPIGEGAMGVVYKAYDSLLERAVALKFPKKIQGADIGRFLQEAKAATRLRHPHIVGVYDIQKHGENYFLVMDFVEGSTLKHFTDSLDIAKAVSIISKIGSAIDYAHSQGIIHRDLKPANIMITSNSEPMVMDFGIAKIVGEDFTHTGASIGTPAYMSPEQAGGEAKKVDARSDVYSLGAIFYELLAGHPPFVGANILAIMHNIVYKQPEPLEKIVPNISSELAKICMKMLEKNREDRYQTAAILVEDLRKFSDFYGQKSSVENIESGLQVSSKKRFKLERKTNDIAVNPELKAMQKELSLSSIDVKSSETTPDSLLIADMKKTLSACLAGDKPDIEFSDSPKSKPEPCEIFSDIDAALPREPVLKCESTEIFEKENHNSAQRKNPISSLKKPISHQVLKETIQLSFDMQKSSKETASRKPIVKKKFCDHWRVLATTAIASLAIAIAVRLFYVFPSKPQAETLKEIKLADGQGWFLEPLPVNMKRGINRGEYIYTTDESIMVYIPPGSFWHEGKYGKFHKKSLLGFYIDKYELSNRQYQKFFEMTGRTSKLRVNAKFKKARQPVVGISWQEAYQYAVWAKKRLPDRYQWEKAARGGLKIPDWKDVKNAIALRANPLEKRRYPWGNEKPAPHLANYKSVEDGYEEITAPTGSFSPGASPYGCQDMAGNAWEWYDSKSRKKICQGGSWNSGKSRLAINARFQPVAERSINIGVRFVCVIKR